MKFFALIGMAAAIRLDNTWTDSGKTDSGIIDQVKSDPAACDKRLWISDDELRW
tara:strand:+ start:89 stop:250 length:162 start_codon:yes stop_codon:yes gene_type:complete